jgi:hypothetical protein
MQQQATKAPPTSKLIQMECGMWCDFGTKNESFLLTAKELRNLGIKNYYFMLEVRNPGLYVQDIDPHNPNISPEDIGKVIGECSQNIWYFLREVCRVPAKGAPQPFRLLLTRASAAMGWCMQKSIDFMCDQPRQTYKTTFTRCLLLWVFLFGLKNVDIPFLHLDHTQARKNAKLFRDYLYELPLWMNPFKDMKKPPSPEALNYEKRNNTMPVISSANSFQDAMDKLRGRTLFVTDFDEYEYAPHFKGIMAGAIPAMKKGREIAKATGGIACNMFTSTPGNLETSDGRAAKAMIDLTPIWSERMYDLSDEALDNLFDGMSEEGEDENDRCAIRRVYIKYNWKQLRKDEKWLRELYNEYKALGEIDEYLRGVLQLRYRGGETTIFDQEDIDYILANIKEHIEPMYMAIDKYPMFIYPHRVGRVNKLSPCPYFDPTIPYMIGIDCATGSGNDSTAFIGINPYTLEIAFEVGSPHMGSHDQTRMVTFLADLLPKAVFCLENNAPGKFIVDFVQESKLEHRFYHDPKLDMTKNLMVQNENHPSALERKATNKKYIGTYVGEQVRKDLFTCLRRNVKEYRHLINSTNLANQINTLIRTKTGRIEHDRGEHDDFVFAYMHILYILQYGANISRFGIFKQKFEWEKERQAVKEYDEMIDERVIDNTPILNHGYEYDAYQENIKPSPMFSFGGRDEYGYTQDQYNTREDRHLQYDQKPTYAAIDYALFDQINNWG